MTEDEAKRQDIRDILVRALDLTDCPIDMDPASVSEIIDLCINEMYSVDRTAFKDSIRRVISEQVTIHFLKGEE